ncbi:hypothetical protein DV735_g2238, partial [Chaetothyriales sp. CBS 134920]
MANGDPDAHIEAAVLNLGASKATARIGRSSAIISITVTESDLELESDFLTLNVPSDLTLNDLKGLVEADTNAPVASQTFVQNGRPITDASKTLSQLGVNEGDLLQLHVRTRAQAPPRPPPGQGATATSQPADPERFRQHILRDQDLMQIVRERAPAVAAAVHDPNQFRLAFEAQQQQITAQQRAWQEELELLNSDPNDERAQRRILEMIQQQQIARNLETAMEETPEAFARVTMLYIDVIVNDVPIKAFVDSGAQSTIMSPDAAERCNISHLIDKRYSGMARGVGTAKILGRVHHAYIQLGQYQAASSFTVMEGKEVDLLLGLDMLKRHQMCIDLKEGCLRVQDDRIPFLPEHEIPKGLEEAKVEGSAGAKTGTVAGTIEPPAPAAPPTAQQRQQPTQQQPPSTAGSSAIAPSSTTPVPTNAQAQPSLGFGQSQPITPQTIAQITDLGFSREEAIAALQQVNGNVELAIGLLL